jgi:hypothetical protein
MLKKPEYLRSYGVKLNDKLSKMVKLKTKKLLNNIFLLAPAFLIFAGSHIYIKVVGLGPELVQAHANLNLIGVGLLTGHVILEEFVL